MSLGFGRKGLLVRLGPHFLHPKSPTSHTDTGLGSVPRPYVFSPQRLLCPARSTKRVEMEKKLLLFERFLRNPFSPSSSAPFSFSSRRWVSHGLNYALAQKGVFVKDRAFRNLENSELRQKGASISGSLSGLPLYVRRNVVGGAYEITKQDFNKLLQQVTTHLSSVSDIYVHDGAIGSPAKSGAKVRLISDNPSAVLALSNVLWKTSSRAVSHDSCPLTVYVASSVSQGEVDAFGLAAKGNNGLIAADTECHSLILCGNGFCDINGTKKALAALAEPIICARGGLPLPARLHVLGDSVILLFAHEDTIRSCANQLFSPDAGAILSSEGVVPYFSSRNSSEPKLLKFPEAVVLATSDSSSTIPAVSKLTPGQAAYHFLAGYDNGKFTPAYCNGPSSIYELELANALLFELKDNQTPSFLVNVSGGKNITDKDILTLVQSSLSESIPPFQPKGGDLQRKYKTFLSSKFKEISKDFSF